MVDDPSSRPDLFPTVESQRRERERLHAIIESLAAWDNARDERLLAQAREEIRRSTGDDPPAILDPFAGGGSIPLEAQRLGLEAHASDLNPVAVLINKALIEIPHSFRDQPPVGPGLADSQIRTWRGAQGLAADVRHYGGWVRQEAETRVGTIYPKAGGRPVLAWIWARTVRCPNPGCGIDVPLVKSWWLAKKATRKVYARPRVVGDPTHQSGLRVRVEVDDDPLNRPEGVDEGTVGRRGAKCVSCATAVPLSYIREEGRAKRLGQQLVTVIADAGPGRSYLVPDEDQAAAASVTAPVDTISGSLGYYPRDLKAPTYGLTEFVDLFTARQLTVITLLSDLVREVRGLVIADGGSPEYADAVVTYLGLAVSRGADYQSNVTTWHYQNEQIRNVFARQAIPMAWDFLEVNILGVGSGTWASQVELAAQALDGLVVDTPAFVSMESAQRASKQRFILSTDPPYYDNVGYSDLSDFFYVWLRRTLCATSILTCCRLCLFQRPRNWSRIRIDTVARTEPRRSSRRVSVKSSPARERLRPAISRSRSTTRSSRANPMKTEKLRQAGRHCSKE